VLCVQMLSTVSLGDRLNVTLSKCGRLWVSTDGGSSFKPTQHYSYKVGRLGARLNRFTLQCCCDLRIC
jgi:hypothetical protein